MPVNRRRMCGEKRTTEQGFTLLELILVVTIIAILGAIAIPQFAGYRQTAFDARSKSDLRNCANAEEAYFVGTGDYLDCSDSACETLLPNFRRSHDVTITVVAANGPQPTFTGSAFTAGGKKTFNYDSAAGGMTN
ncbi:MAG: prepilin-type N-terminal cleavage/methylation domain-containing protein [bacterium]